MEKQSRTGIARGALYISLATGVFYIGGYIIHVWLGHRLDPVDYGVFGIVVTGLLGAVNTLVTTGFPRSAAKYISEDTSRIGSIVRDANRLQIILSLVIFALYFGLADVIAAALNDPSLDTYIRLSAFCLPAYALFSVYRLGYLNGTGQFGKQALGNIAHSMLKIIAVFALVMFGYGVKGAIIGYLIALLGGLALTWWFLGPVPKEGTGFGMRKLLFFGVPATLFAYCNYLLVQVGLFTIKSTGIGDEEVGYYTGAIAVTRLLTVVAVGLGMALFPSISNSVAQRDNLRTGRYIEQSIRYLLLVTLPFIVLMSTTATELMGLFYPDDYELAGGALAILVFGVGGMMVFSTCAVIIMGSGRPGIALSIIAPMLVIEFILNAVLVPEYGMEGGAWAHTITGITGMCAASAYVYWRFRALIPLLSLSRLLLASAIIYIIAVQISVTYFWLPVIYLAFLVLYLGVLMITREIGLKDWQMVRAVVSKNKSNGRDRDESGD